MPDDREIARRALDFEARARDFRLLDIPKYKTWSERKLKDGESPALIAHLDAMSVCLLPEEIGNIEEREFEEYLDDLKAELGIDNQ